jgi:hypothetical protein
MGIFADIFQIGTHKRKRLALRPFLDLHQPLDRLLMKQVATHAITCISGITDNRSIPQAFNNRLNQPELGIIGVNFNQHAFYSPYSPCPANPETDEPFADYFLVIKQENNL